MSYKPALLSSGFEEALARLRKFRERFLQAANGDRLETLYVPTVTAGGCV
jgi:hypothetical protein